MPPFNFSLEQVLDHRKRLEDEAHKALALAQMRLEECQGAMARLDESRQRSAREMYSQAATGMHEGQRRIYANYLAMLRQEMERLGKVEAELRVELERARRNLVEALRNREILEEVRKSEYQEYLREQKSEEAKLYDELAQRAWRMASGENLAAHGKEN